MLKPRALRRGSKIALIAPASPFDRAEFDRGVEELRHLGFEPCWEPSVFARESYLASFHERFTEDLRGIAASPPPFVGPSLVQWMHDESDRLRRAIESHEAFDEPLDTPVHGDLWLNNIHWVDAGEWYVLDWDDLRIGDPAADVAALLGPSATDLRPLKLVEHAIPALTPAQRARLPLLGRATLLDWVIDPLSDWIDAHAAPQHLEEVRAQKERTHREALACYRTRHR